MCFGELLSVSPFLKMKIHTQIWDHDNDHYIPKSSQFFLWTTRLLKPNLKKKNPWATSVSSRFFSDWGKGFSYLSSTYSNCRRGRAREFHMVIFAVSLFKRIEWHQKFPGSLTMRDTITMMFSFRRTSFRLHNVHLENILVMV